MFNYNVKADFVNRSFLEKSICKKYDFVQKSLVGISFGKRPIFSYSIGYGKEKVLYVGAFHGMEWLTSLYLEKFLEQCCYAIKNHKTIGNYNIDVILKKRVLCIIPCVNPDGVEIQIKGSQGAGNYKRLVESISKDTTHWQANARGIDLNHNFNADWKQLKALEIENKITKPSATRFGGTFPCSEEETIALVKFCSKNNFSRAYAFHSQGREIYWNFGKNTPENSQKIAKELSQVSGYSVAEPEGLAVGGGFKDWFIQTFHKPAFTIETGLGKNPLPLSDFTKEYKLLLPLLCTGLFL